MEFNKVNFEAFRNDAKEALREVAEKYDVEISFGNISYTDFEFDLKMHVAKRGDEDTDMSQLKFERECMYYGFKKEDYNKEFIMDGKKFRFVGFNTRARKNVCQILCLADGKTYVCNSMLVHRFIDK